MSDFVNSVDILGDDVLTDSIIEKTLESYADDVVKSIGSYAFSKCTALINVNLPNVQEINNYAFNDCTALTSVIAPLVETRVNFYAFQNCLNLANVDFPLLKRIDGSAFSGCAKITSVDFPLVTYIGNQAFAKTGLATLILRNETMVQNGGYIAINTPIASGTGYIYVPSSLVDSYKADSNWSTYANQFRALEDYTVDGTTTGELDPNKI